MPNWGPRPPPGIEVAGGQVGDDREGEDGEPHVIAVKLVLSATSPWNRLAAVQDPVRDVRGTVAVTVG